MTSVGDEYLAGYTWGVSDVLYPKSYAPAGCMENTQRFFFGVIWNLEN